LIITYQNFTGFFVKYVCSILVNSFSISLFNVCNPAASDFTRLNYYSTEAKHLIAAFIYYIRLRFDDATD
jgi:hypothetical protein